MRSVFPKDPKQLKTRIRSYEKALKKRNCDDGYGKRFLVGTLYLLLSDLEGAIRFYDCYTKRFSEDGVEPLNHMSWALALYRTKQRAATEGKLIEAAIENPHIWEWLCGGSMARLDIWYGSNWSEPEYLLNAPSEYCKLWTEKERAWVREFFQSPHVAAIREEVLSIRHQLKNLHPGPDSTFLVKRLYEIKNSLRIQGAKANP